MNNRLICFVCAVLSFLTACGAQRSSNTVKSSSSDTATGLPIDGDETLTAGQVHDLVVKEYGFDPLDSSRPISLVDMSPTVCIAKNRNFIGQFFFSGKVPLSETLAMAEALTACVQWSAKDKANRDATQCYIAGCEPTETPDPENVKIMLAKIIAQIIGS